MWEAEAGSGGGAVPWCDSVRITTVGPNDGNNLFTHFLIANGGEGIITPDGKLHTDDPKVREGYEGYSPAWGQASSEQLWGQAHADVIKNGVKVADAVDKAFKRCNEIFTRIVM